MSLIVTFMVNSGLSSCRMVLMPLLCRLLTLLVILTMPLFLARLTLITIKSLSICFRVICFFFQAEDGIRDLTVTGVQTCALPISSLFGALWVHADSWRPKLPLISSSKRELRGRTLCCSALWSRAILHDEECVERSYRDRKSVV